MKKCFLIFCLSFAIFSPLQFAFSQNGGGAEAIQPSLSEIITKSNHKYYFFPGSGNFGGNEPNVFTLTFCMYMEELLGEDFLVVAEALSHKHLINIAWALWNGQRPLNNPKLDTRTRKTFERIATDPHDLPDTITIVSSSFGTVIAAQVGIYLANHCRENGRFHQKIDIIFGASMLSKDSDLFLELEALQKEGMVRHIVYNELQDPGDNVTGMCSNSRLSAFVNAFEIACIFGGTHRGQPSILKDDPNNGHIHLQRAQSVDKAREFVRVIFIDHELARPEIREKAFIMLNP